MAEILVLVDHVDGAVRKTTPELLTLARRLGEPAAVFLGAGWTAARDTLAELRRGERVVRRSRTPTFGDYLVAPKAEALPRLVAAAQPAAVLVAATAGGQGDRRPPGREHRVGDHHRRGRRRRGR